MKRYDHKQIEPSWRKYWEENNTYATPTEVDPKNKRYILPQLPYPSGSGLHAGHSEIYIACDIYARYQRMIGNKVLQVMGWDAFGLPAENFAIKTNTHPRISTNKAIDNFREQIKLLGMSVDWSREVGSHNPDYYKWTQWFFLLMLERGLAYRKNQAVNWCDSCKTVLANEQVENGKCERCGTQIVQKEMEQWFLRITDYADRLYDDLDKVDWPAETVKRQRDWIGRSKGALIDFSLEEQTTSESIGKVQVFTTRPDTIFGATFMVLSPEHPMIEHALAKINNKKEVMDYVSKAALKTELERQQQKEKDGVKLEGIVAINPANNQQIPVFVADYVLVTYGTGAIMAVPAHDERDFEVATKHGLEIKVVVTPPIEISRAIYLIPSHILDGSEQLKEYIKQNPGGINEYNMDDGVYQEEVSGLHVLSTPSEACMEAIHEARQDMVGIMKGQIMKAEDGKLEELDLRGLAEWLGPKAYSELQQLDVFKKNVLTVEPGVAVNSADFSGITTQEATEQIVEWLGRQGVARNHTTYRLRDWSVSRQRFWGAPIPIVFDPEGNPHPVEKHDLPVILPDDVDFMPTGQSPLTYSEAFQAGVENKYGKGWKREVDTLDTFMCSSWYYFRYIDPHNEQEFASPKALKTWMPVDFYLGGTEHVNGHLLYSRFFTKVLHDAGYIDFDEPFTFHRHQGTVFGPDGRRMSKRWGNIVNPTDVVADYGADTVRAYLMFMGPLEQDKAWNDSAVQGVHRFIQRAYSFEPQGREASQETKVALNKLIKKVTDDLPNLRYNTAIAEFMKFLNLVEENPTQVSVDEWKVFVKLLAPFAPYVTEQLWNEIGGEGSVHHQSWPELDSGLLSNQPVNIAVQINGKSRGVITVPVDAEQNDVLLLVLNDPKLSTYVTQEQVRKVIFVKGKILNILTK